MLREPSQGFAQIPPGGSLKFNKRSVLIVVALTATIVYFCIALATDAPRMYQALHQMGWTGCSLVLGLSAANYILRYRRWQLYIERLGHYLPPLRHFLYYIGGFAFTVSPAKSGELLRSLYMRGHGVSYSQCVAAVFVERLLDLFSLTILASLVVAQHASFIPLILGVLLIALALVIASCQSWVPGFLEIFATRFNSKTARVIFGLANLTRASRSLLRAQPLMIGLAVGLAAWGAEGCGFLIICNSFHLSISAPVAIGIYSISLLAGSAAFFLPAGIGGMEVVMSALLVSQGAALKTAVIATLLCRLATLWFAVLLGISALSTVELMDRRRHLGEMP